MSIRPALRHIKGHYLTPWLMAQTVDTWAGKIIQSTYDWRVGAPPANRPGRLKTWFFEQLSGWIRRLGDPLVKYPIGGQRLWLPFSHEGPAYRREFPLVDTNIARVAGATAAKYSDLKIISATRSP
jgi:hypothetical protein